MRPEDRSGPLSRDVDIPKRVGDRASWLLGLKGTAGPSLWAWSRGSDAQFRQTSRRHGLAVALLLFVWDMKGDSGRQLRKFHFQYFLCFGDDDIPTGPRGD